MNIQHKTLKTATAQVLAQKLFLESEETRASWYSAVIKAEIEINKNKTIEFDGIRVTFVSRESGKARIITRHGCTNLCDCNGKPSYHSAIFAILERADQIEKELTPIEITNQSIGRTNELLTKVDQTLAAHRVTLDSYDNAPLMKPASGKRPEYCGSIRI